MIRTLYQQIKEYRAASIMTPMWTALEVVMDVMIPYVTASLIDRGIKTHEQVTRERGGGDWEENVEQLRRENELLKAAGGGQTDAVNLNANGEEGDGDSGGTAGE